MRFAEGALRDDLQDSVDATFYELPLSSIGVGARGSGEFFLETGSSASELTGTFSNMVMAASVLPNINTQTRSASNAITFTITGEGTTA